jgi:hypothetical protein
VSVSFLSYVPVDDVLVACGIVGISELCVDCDGDRSGAMGRRRRERNVTLNQHQVLSRLSHLIYTVLALLMDRTFLIWIWCSCLKNMDLTEGL